MKRSGPTMLQSPTSGLRSSPRLKLQDVPLGVGGVDQGEPAPARWVGRLHLAKGTATMGCDSLKRGVHIINLERDVPEAEIP
jgi:hypothetical protein